jgi:hypothetical protein
MNMSFYKHNMKIGRIEENTPLDKKEGSTLNEHVGNTGTIHIIVITYFVEDSLAPA